jgi:hypothetical protein
MLLWAIAVVGALAALGAWTQARRLKRRLDALNHSYWELRYEYTRLRSIVARLEGGSSTPVDAPREAPGEVSFVPISSLRK